MADKVRTAGLRLAAYTALIRPYQHDKQSCEGKKGVISTERATLGLSTDRRHTDEGPLADASLFVVHAVEGSKAIQSTTASEDSPAKARETAAGSSISAVTLRAPAGIAPMRRPRLSNVSSMPLSYVRTWPRNRPPSNLKWNSIGAIGARESACSRHRSRNGSAIPLRGDRPLERGPYRRTRIRA